MWLLGLVFFPTSPAILHFFSNFRALYIHAETLHLSQNQVLSSLNLISMALIVQVFLSNRVQIKNVSYIITLHHHQKKTYAFPRKRFGYTWLQFTSGHSGSGNVTVDRIPIDELTQHSALK